MIISILTLFPELYKPFIKTSLLSRAQEKNIVQFDLKNLFNFCVLKERVDGPTYGHSAGMVLRPEVIQKGVEEAESTWGKAYKIFFSPHGKKLDQRSLKEMVDILAEKKHIMLLPARYEGMDARIEKEYADEIISLGDIVFMGGDIPAMAFLEAFLRLVPGIVGKQESVEKDSFSGPFVDHPAYTAPLVWKDHIVPDVIRSGDHKSIKQWEEKESVQRTIFNHFDWVRTFRLSNSQKQICYRVMPSHYVVLMHDGVLLPNNVVGTSSVTSIDIHDIARSAKTYGLKNYFLVTSLVDQQRIVGTLLDFWQKGAGLTYNTNRSEAIESVILESSLDHVIERIEKKEGKKPLLLGTGARSGLHQKMISYYDQEKVWALQRPVVFLLGTSHGLGPEILASCDFMLEPLYGFFDFNHLSVRSAAGIIFDRWLGINPK